MVTNPKPCGRVSFEDAQGPIAQGDPERPDVGLGFYTFESKRRMERIFFPDLESFLAFWVAFRDASGSSL
jgi:hypothetical protein